MKKHLLFLFAIMISVGSAWAQTGTLVSMSTAKSTVKITVYWSGDGKILANGTEIPNNLETEVAASSRRVILTASGDVKLISLYCSDNDLTQLDVTNCTELDYLQCDKNRLTSLDLSNCPVRTVWCDNNNLTSLDVSKCTNLIQLLCGYNILTSLNLSGCPNLTHLQCEFNSLTSLDISKCTKLSSMLCYRNHLRSLDVSNCPELTSLDCYSNNLSSLDVSKCTKLTGLSCSYNSISVLDVSNCPDIDWFYCHDNGLSNLDVTNLTKLKVLGFQTNQLTSIDISKCPELTHLYCSNNQLTNINLTNCPNLIVLYCDDNRISSLNLSECPNVTQLGCGHNRLAYLNLGYTQLESMFANNQNVVVSITSSRYRNPIQYIKAGVAENIEIERVKYAHNDDLPTKSASFTFTTDKTEATGDYPFSGNLTLIGHTPTTHKPVESIRFSHESIKLQVGQTLRLGYTVLPEDATNKEVIWEVEGRGQNPHPGQNPNDPNQTTVVSISPVNNNSNNDNYNYNTAGNVESMPITSFSSTFGEYTPWVSNVPAVAHTGEFDITGISSGVVQLKITTVDGSKTLQCNIEVLDYPVPIEVSDVVLHSTLLLLKVGETSTLGYTILPYDAEEKSVYWTSNHTNIATVSTGGLVTAVTPGITTVTVTTDNSKYISQCIVVVSKIPTGIDDVNQLTFQAYPNPTSGIITISGLTPGTQFKLYSAIGKLVGTYTAQAEQMTINLSGYAKGMYLIQYNGKTYKIIKK